MELFYISQDYLNILKNEFEKNIESGKYYSNEPFVSNEHNSEFILKSNINVENINLEFYTDGRENSKLDLKNAKEIYLKLKKLTRRQATDERLWQYLLHTSCWEYMRYRWPLEKSGNKERYFLNDKNDRAIMRHGISRLWWIAHETYDSDNQLDPFHLTEFVLSDQDLIRNFLERAFYRNNTFTKNMLICMKEYFNTNQYTNKRDAIRYLVVEINKISAIRIIEDLSKDELKVIINKILDEYYKNNKRAYKNINRSEQLSLLI